jgi:hypothetical protein
MSVAVVGSLYEYYADAVSGIFYTQTLRNLAQADNGIKQISTEKKERKHGH